MALSKNEQIALFIVVFLLIAVAGFFIFINPAMQQIKPNQEALEAKQKELADLETEFGTEAFEAVGRGIMDNYAAGKDASLGFHNEVTLAPYGITRTEFRDYEADRLIRGLLAEENLSPENLNILRLNPSSLSVNLFTPSNISYSIKELARVIATVERLAQNDPIYMNRTMAQATSRRNALDTFNGWLNNTGANGQPVVGADGQPLSFDNQDAVKALLRFLATTNETVAAQTITFTLPMTEAQADSLSMRVFERELATYIRTLTKGDPVSADDYTPAEVDIDVEGEEAPPPPPPPSSDEEGLFVYTVEILFYVVEPMESPNQEDFEFVVFP